MQERASRIQPYPPVDLPGVTTGIRPKDIDRFEAILLLILIIQIFLLISSKGCNETPSGKASTGKPHSEKDAESICSIGRQPESAPSALFHQTVLWPSYLLFGAQDLQVDTEYYGPDDLTIERIDQY